MGAILVFTWLLNVFDAVATWTAVTRGYGVELNPFMRVLLSHGFWWFFLVKNLMVAGGLLFLYSKIDWYPRLVKTILWISFGSYALLAITHLVGLFLV